MSYVRQRSKSQTLDYILDGDKTICSKVVSDTAEHERIMNLLCAAPDLLEALEALFSMNEDEAMMKEIAPERMDKVLTDAYAAITKARGEA